MKNKYIHRIFWVLVIIVTWQMLYWVEMYDALQLPSFYEVLVTLVKDISADKLLISVTVSLLIIFEGLLIGIIVAFLLSCFSYVSKTISYFTDTLLSIFHPLPGIALLPIVILWVGVGRRGVLIIVINSVLWPMIVNIRAGFQSVDSELIEAAKSNGANKLQLFYHVIVPLSFLQILSGFKIAWARSFRALISAEMIIGAISSTGGLGWYLVRKRSFMDTEGMYAGLIVVIIIGYVFEDLIFKFFIKKSDFLID